MQTSFVENNFKWLRRFDKGFEWGKYTEKTRIILLRGLWKITIRPDYKNICTTRIISLYI